MRDSATIVAIPCQFARKVAVSMLGCVATCMIEDMEIARRTWTAAVKLAVVVSLLAATAAFAVSRLGEVPRVAVVMPVIIVAFAASWMQTERIRRQALDDMVIMSARSTI